MGRIRSARANWLAARTLCVNYFGEGVVHLIARDDHVGLVLLPELSFELAPFLLGPSKLLCRRGKVQEVHRNDVGPGSQVGIADKSIELAAGLGQSRLDLLQPLLLLFGVVVSTVSSQAYSLWHLVSYRAICEVLGPSGGAFVGPANNCRARKVERTSLVLECTSALSQ